MTVTFDVQKSVEREPNSAAVKITNLNPETRRQFEQGQNLQLEIVAGYLNNSDIIFSGDVNDVWTERNNTEPILSIEAKDGGRSYRSSRITRSFDAGVSLVTVISACAQAMGVGIGNTTQIASSASLDSGGNTFANGYTLDGVAWRELNEVVRSAGMRWSVQNGALQLRATGQPADTTAIRLSPTTGLIGSPSRGKQERNNRRAVVNARSLLIPGLYPGRIVQLESSEVTGGWLCRRVKYIGESTGQNWYCDLELTEY